MSKSGLVPPPVHPASAPTIEERLSRLPEPPPLPDRLTLKALRDAVAGLLVGVSTDYLEEECVNFGLPGQADQYHPDTLRAGGTLPRQRTDFLLLLPRQCRIAIELDGIQRYADDGVVGPARYAVMAAADREPRLARHEIHGFGDYELADRLSASGPPGDFFSLLLSEPDERP